MAWIGLDKQLVLHLNLSVDWFLRKKKILRHLPFWSDPQKQSLLLHSEQLRQQFFFLGCSCQGENQWPVKSKSRQPYHLSSTPLSRWRVQSYAIIPWGSVAEDSTEVGAFCALCGPSLHSWINSSIWDVWGHGVSQRPVCSTDCKLGLGILIQIPIMSIDMLVLALNNISVVRFRLQICV